VAAAVVFPEACDCTSTAASPAAVDRPEYSSAVTPTSADDDTVAVTVGLVPPPAVTGALQTLISVLSEAVKCVISVYVLPAESVTFVAVAEEVFHTPTWTISRFPVVIGAPSATAAVVPLDLCTEACWTNVGETTFVGTTAFDGAEAGPVPAELVAVTVKV